MSNILYKKNNKQIELKYSSNFNLIKVEFLQKSIIYLFLLRLILISIKILKVGVVNYFTGSLLVSTIENYGKENINSGFVLIFDNLVSSIHVILAIIYICLMFKMGAKISFYLLSLVFIFIPLLSLSRNSFAFGLLLMLIVYSLEKRDGGRISKKIFYISFISIFLSFFISIVIGGIRESKITASEESTDVFISLYGELSPIIVYNDLYDKIDELGYQFGYTIVPPLIFKIIPRSWYPNKPINSTALYSLKYEKESFDAGFMIPSTIFGDLFLNFGFYFSLLFFFLFGFLVCKIDQIYLCANFSGLKYFIIFYLNFYGLLRNNLPEGLFPLVQGFILYFLLNAVFNSIVNYKLKNENT